MWVLLTAFLVFFMNLGFACVESGLCRAKNAVNILAKNFIVFAVIDLALLAGGLGLMFGGGNRYFGKEGLWFVSGADNSPATGDATRVSTAQSPGRRSAQRQVLLSAGVRRNRGDDRVRRRGRARSSSFVHCVHASIVGVASIRSRSLDLGRRLVGDKWASSISPVPRWCTRSAAGRR